MWHLKKKGPHTPRNEWILANAMQKTPRIRHQIRFLHQTRHSQVVYLTRANTYQPIDDYRRYDWRWKGAKNYVHPNSTILLPVTPQITHPHLRLPPVHILGLLGENDCQVQMPRMGPSDKFVCGPRHKTKLPGMGIDTIVWERTNLRLTNGLRVHQLNVFSRYRFLSPLTKGYKLVFYSTI